MAHAVFVDGPDGLAAIRSADVTLAVWHRRELPPLPKAGMFDTLDDIALTTPVATARDALSAALTGAGYAAPSIDALADDIAGHAARLADLLVRERVKIRLDVIDTDACKRFHADYVALRLICTYVGPGTQWLDRRDAAAFRGGADPATLTLRTVATGAVALFKGHDAAGDAAIVHRSPPIAGSGTRRLVLVIDGA